MDDDTSFQPKNSSKMAELFMECEEEELEPWQKKIETQEEDDDELIFVGAIPGSKSPISSDDYEDSTSSPEAALPRFHPESRSSCSSDIVQNVSKPDFAKNSSQVESDESSDLPFCLSQNTIPLSQDGSTIYIEGLDETLPKIKHSDISKVNSVNPKKPKTSKSVSEINPCASLSLINSSSATSSYFLLSKGTHTSSTANKTGTFFVRACPKCNVQFNLLDPLKYHMKVCCPDLVDAFLEMIKVELSSTENKNLTGAEKGKLIMLVSDFYYGRHEGTFDDDEKTYTTFKCFSCLKILKNNIRFMNHMKHHLELEKQNSESWENHTTCQHCYRQYPTPFQLQCHIESTHTPLEFSTICKICELSFETEHILLQHMKDTHKPGEMPYICQVCQYRSSSFSDVEAHFRASHENTKNLLCPFCLKVSRMATPYMNHYMKHQQKKGIHRCTQCRLQFLTYKEKLDHKIEHRTFVKPKELEGLPPGTKVTIRASIGSLHSRPSTSKSILPSNSSASTSLQVSSSKSKGTTTGSSLKSHASEYKTRKFRTTASTGSKPSTSKQGRGAYKYRAKTSYKPKKKRNRRSKISIALKNLRCRRGIYTCIECHSKIKDFASHFSLFMHCNFCKYSTNCNKAFVNHMLSSHSSQPSKRFYIFKRRPRALRGITLVCLKCDFLADDSALDRMAKHLSQRKTHTCQVIIEDVPESTSAFEPTSALLLK
ncbi:zinc finger protein 280C isoform X1 [Moschus berezovskii]|uniref:zinc finger protein 280C isoform X1 n=1 Tax=Moschus berezovskii TaxID=68408 RepID=UPI0024440705|nr:zinc finger protein 280C isoform X1 [Moschus berezovskii]XP_055249458.1 zinc finger protein 280C isoform X1 [Moschus berezovskii]